jgi:membrane protease YdiL (CAAX protease family)
VAKQDARSKPSGTAALDLSGRRDGYTRLATRPLHILAFLVPLIALFEFGAWRYLGADPAQRETILAQRMLEELFAWLGVTGLHLPAILTVVVLLIWHVLTRDRWRVRAGVVGGMWLEAAVWTAPLLVLGVILARALGVGLEPASETDLALAEASLGEKWTIAIGAGLFEELLFRLLGITLMMLVFEDVLRLGKKWAVACALVVTSVAFSWYHHPFTDGGVDWGLATYFTLAGAYFGLVYVTRGFGIAVGVHALYDLVVLIDPLG